MLRTSRQQAREALNKFYNEVYRFRMPYKRRDISENRVILNVISISDCAIIFSRNIRDNERDKIRGLTSLLSYIRFVNRSLIRSYSNQPQLLTKCSICYGNFNFEIRDVEEGIDKEFLYGLAYLNAYIDTEINYPKLDVGECRIIKRNLPNNIISILENQDEIINRSNVFSFLRDENNYYYFYWMLNNIEQLNTFKNEYFIERDNDINYYDEKKQILNKYINMQNRARE